MAGNSGFTIPYLRAWRNHRIMSQKELAEKAGITEATVSRLETGGRVRYSTVAKLADALGITREQLLRSEPKRAAA